MAAKNKKTNAELATEVPALIEEGFGLYEASRELHVGMPRLHELATKAQIEALKKNGETRRFKKGTVTDEKLKELIDQAIADGLGINQTLKKFGICHYRLHRTATPKQIEALKCNGMTKKGPSGKSYSQTVAIKGIRKINDPLIAKAKMQDIIANHPAIGRHYV